MKSIKIYYHSFVDLITNSSSVVYVNATESTVQAIKDVVNSILKLSNSKLTADDLFEFKIYSEKYDERNSYVEVTAKVDDDVTAIKTAKLLSNLNSLFDLEGGYDG